LVFTRRPPTERASPILDWASAAYKPLLAWSMNNRAKVVTIALAAIVGSFLLTPFLGSEFIPELEEGNIWLRVTILPTSVSLDKAVSIAHSLREQLRRYPEVTNVVSHVGSPDDGTDPNAYSNLEIFVDLKPQDEWRKQFPTKQALVNAINQDLL